MGKQSSKIFTWTFVGLLGMSISPVDAFVINHCGPTSLPNRTGQGTADSIAEVSAAYPVPPDYGYEGGLNIQNITLNGVQLVQITFKFNPFQAPAFDDPVFEQLVMRKNAAIVFPVNNARRDILAVSSNMGTSNGIAPSLGDALHTPSQMQSWWYGTNTGLNFQKTMASVATSYNVPVGFYDPIPNTIEFTTDTQSKLQLVREASSPGDLCDDLRCNGVLTDDGDVHDCLGDLSHMDSVVIPPQSSNSVASIHLNAGIFYAIANIRFLEVAQQVANGYLQQYYPNDPLFTFANQDGVAVIGGGSKRGASALYTLLSDPRFKGAWAGHANMSNFINLAIARENVWDHTYYFAGYELANFLVERPEWSNKYDLAYIDPALWAGKTVLVTSGLKDTYFLNGSENLYRDALPSNTTFFMHPNYPHGGGTYGYAVAWRNLVNYIANGSPMMRVDAALNYNDNKVYAKVIGAAPSRVELWCTTQASTEPVISLRHTDYPECATVGTNYFSPSPDNRYAHMTKVNMQLLSAQDQIYRGTPPVGQGGYQTWKSCVVFAAKQAGDPMEATSVTLHNQALCALNGLPDVQTDTSNLGGSQ